MQEALFIYEIFFYLLFVKCIDQANTENIKFAKFQNYVNRLIH